MLFEKNLHLTWCLFSIKIKKNCAGTAHCGSAILDEFNEHYKIKHQSIKKFTEFNAYVDLMHLLVGAIFKTDIFISSAREYFRGCYLNKITKNAIFKLPNNI